MKTLCLLLIITLLPLFSKCSQYFDICQQKVVATAALEEGNVQVPVGSDLVLGYHSKKPLSPHIKYDKFLGLTLSRQKRKQNYYFQMYGIVDKSLALVNSKFMLDAKIRRHQVGLDSLATLYSAAIVPSLLLDSCCSFEGIATPHGIIERAYISHFLHTESSVYADAGFRVDPKSKLSVIESVNPFVKNMPFQKGDVVLALNGKKVYSPAQLMRRLLFLKPQSRHTFLIQRGTQRIKQSYELSERLGGGLISDTYLESIGVFFDKSLNVTQIEDKVGSLGIREYDRLLAVNGVLVDSDSAVRMALTEKKPPYALLIERNGFQFFIHLNTW